MTTTEMFSDFLGNLKIDIKQAKKISYHYRKITRALNKSFRSSESPVTNRLKVGSVGRHTAIKGISDLDMLYIMPGGLYDVYNNMCNGQSLLLTHVKDALSAIYPDQEVRKDRLVVQVIFKHFQVEVQPVFRQDNGDFWYPESYGGGAWKVTRPSEEIAAMTAFSRTKSNNLRRLCKMVRAWKNRNGVNMGGLLIDTLVWRFLSSTNQYDTASLSRFDVLSRDFFAFLAAETRQSRYHALGSGQHVKVKSPWFGRAARQAFDLCEKANAATDEESKHALWRSVYGRAFTHASDLHALLERLLLIRSSAANQGDGIEKHIIHLVSKNSSTVPQELKITPFTRSYTCTSTSETRSILNEAFMHDEKKVAGATFLVWED